MMPISLEWAKLHRFVDFLQSLPFVGGQKIGCYGLPYGRYSAIWMLPLEPRLKIIIVSGVVDDWRLMLTVLPKDHAGSFDYWSLPDEDLCSWKVLNRFTHTELIAAMWPRPVCIEWGLYDPTTTPERHELAGEDLKANFVDPWDIVDKAVDDDHVGVHMVHGMGAFSFIDRWLWPERSAERDCGCDGEHCCNLDAAPGSHGYMPISGITVFLDSTQESIIRGRF